MTYTRPPSNKKFSDEIDDTVLPIFNAVVSMLKKMKKYEGVTFYFWALKCGDYLEVRYETHFGYDYLKVDLNDKNIVYVG